MRTAAGSWGTRRRGLVLLVVALCLPAGAAARQHRPKVAVLEVKTVGTFERDAVAGLSSLIASEAARFPVEVVAAADLAALLDLDRQKSLLGCGDSACLAEVGGALGVDYLLSSEVSRVGGLWLVTVALLEVSKTKGAGRITQRSENEDGLVATTSAAVGLAMRSVFAVEPAPGREGSGQRVVGYALDGVGVVLLASGAVAGILGRSAFNEADALAKGGEPSRQADFESARASAETRLFAADLMLAGGVVAGAAGLLLTFTAPDSSAGMALGAAPSRSGGTLTLSGEF